MSTDFIQSTLNRSFTDKFYFLMNLPNAMKNFKEDYNRNLNEGGIKKETIGWTLIKTSIPEVLIKSQSIGYSGGNHYISSHVKEPYSPLSIEFKVDSLYNNYSILYEWLNYIYDEKYGHFDANNLAKDAIGTSSYATTISVIATDGYEKDTIMWTFKNAFPTRLSGISLDYRDSSEIVCTADFVFSQMYIKNFNLKRTENNSLR